MIRLSITILTAILISSCSQQEGKFCDCLNTSEALNSFSKTLWDIEVTKEDEKKQQNLREAKKIACKVYQKMGGEEMKKLKEKCEDQ